METKADDSKPEFKNHPFDKVVADANVHVLAGRTVHQKFTCSHCGTRQTMEMPNVFYTTGQCEECKQITNIRETGCNFLLVITP